MLWVKKFLCWVVFCVVLISEPALAERPEVPVDIKLIPNVSFGDINCQPDYISDDAYLQRRLAAGDISAKHVFFKKRFKSKNVGKLSAEEKSLAKKYLYEAAEAGYPSAFMTLCRVGSPYIPKGFLPELVADWGFTFDLNDTLRYCARSAEAGYTLGNEVLERLYREGVHVKQDMLEAAFWLFAVPASPCGNRRDVFEKEKDSLFQQFSDAEVKDLQERLSVFRDKAQSRMLNSKDFGAAYINIDKIACDPRKQYNRCGYIFAETRSLSGTTFYDLKNKKILERSGDLVKCVAPPEWVCAPEIIQEETERPYSCEFGLSEAERAEAKAGVCRLFN